MNKVLIIGAGSIASVIVAKCCQNSEVFGEICIASRTKEKCDQLMKCYKGSKTAITTAQLNANKIKDVVELINVYKPSLVINVALPYQDLTIMDACLETGVHYLDTANYEPLEKAKSSNYWQWTYKEKFEKAALTAILVSGFDPDVTVMTGATLLLRDKWPQKGLCNVEEFSAELDD